MNNILVLLALVLFMNKSVQGQDTFTNCGNISRSNEDNVQFKTPATGKIEYTKILKEKEVYQMHLFASGADPEMDQKGVRIIFSNGKVIFRPEQQLTISLTKSNKIPFRYSVTIELTPAEIQNITYYSIKEYRLGSHSCQVTKTESSRLFENFRCLLNSKEDKIEVTATQ